MVTYPIPNASMSCIVYRVCDYCCESFKTQLYRISVIENMPTYPVKLESLMCKGADDPTMNP